MRKQEFIDSVAEKAGTTRAAASRMVDAIFDSAGGAISEAVQAGKQVNIPGFGKFRSKVRNARKGRNPRTGAEIDIPEATVIAFTPGKGLRDSLQGGGGAKGKSAGGKKAAGGTKTAGTGAKKTAAGGKRSGAGGGRS